MNKELLKLGYKRYQGSEILFSHSSHFWQKRFEDKKGVRYFLDFVYYGPTKDYAGGWECEMRISAKKLLYIIKIGHMESVKLIEKEMLKIWKAYRKRNAENLESVWKYLL